MYDLKALYQAKSVADAVSLRLAHPEAHIIAGGSDVLVQMREGKRAGVELISIQALDEIRGVSMEADGTIRDTVKDEVLDGDSIVSMNFWGFTPWIFKKIEEYFHDFLKNLPDGELKAECLLPILVDNLIRKGEMDVAVLHSDAKWFGMTYQEDKPIVAAALRELHDAGEYPKTLR